MANLKARLESLLEELTRSPPPPVILIRPLYHSDRFTIIGHSQQATKKDIRQHLRKPPTFKQRQIESDLVPRPVNSRKKQHIPNHSK